MLILHNKSLDVAEHLALEGLLLDRVDDLAPCLYLWRSRCSVVIGKHQNPWKECDLTALASDDGVLARRISGGGAVYHDPGNLNFSLVISRDRYRQGDLCDVVVGVLQALGLTASVLGHASIGVNGRKCSGHAFCYRKCAVLHHGTMLVDSDLERLKRYLVPSTCHFRTHAVSSNPAEVVNVKSLRSELDTASVSQALEEGFQGLYGGQRQVLDAHQLFAQGQLEELISLQRSWDWTFGRTPTFEVALRNPPQFVTVRQGRVAHVTGDGPVCEGMRMVHEWL